MTVALWCLLVAAVLPLASAAVAKAGFKNFDNHHPREWLSRQQGLRARANAAQQNSWEALAVFTAAVAAAHISDAPQDTVDALAVAFIAVRIVYTGLYIADRPTLRSVTWLVGFALCVALFAAGA